MNNTKKTVTYFLFIIQLAVIFAFWLRTSGSELLFNPASAITALGRLSGLLAAFFILLQFVLRGRLIIFEKIFGFETLNALHKKNGYVAFGFLFIHPVLLTIGYALSGKKNLFTQFMQFLTVYEYVWLAFIGWVLFMTIITTSVYIIRKKLRYEIWYFIHLGTYLAIFFAWWHQLRVGTDFLVNKWFVYYWYGLYGLVFGSLLYFRFFTILYRFFKYRFYIEHISQETADTVSIYIKGRYLHAFIFEPGQFAFFRFLAKNYWWESHPFSFSSIPNGEYIRLTIKSEGDFTSQILKIKRGTPVSLDGPHGAFSERFMQKNKVLFIAGGVGITPIRSLLEGIDKKKKTVLFYANRTSKEILFKKELDELSVKYQFPIYHIISREDGYKGIKGRINLELIKKYITNFQNYEIYLCGPISMAKSLSADLLSAGVPKKQIHYEEFAL